MLEFKVGDRVKTCFGIGKVIEINNCLESPYLVYHDIWNNGHNGNGFSKKEYSGNHCHWFSKSMLELLEPSKTSEIKIDSSGITSIYGRFKTHIIVDDLSKDYEIIEKKEGNDMLESLNLVDLYFNEQKEKLQNERNSKVDKIRKNNNICKQLEKISENTKKQLNELYLSQLDDEDLEKLQNGKKIDYSKYPFYCTGEIELSYSGCYKNPCFINDEIKKIDNDIDDKISELAKLIKIVKAHVGIAKTKEEVEDILTKYDILDKKGKLKV